MQEQVSAVGIANHPRLPVPEMRLQVLANDLQLILEAKRPKLVSGLTASDIETPVPQGLAQAGGQLAACTGEVIDGCVLGIWHDGIVSPRC